MPLKVAVQMDHVSTITIAGDTTLRAVAGGAAARPPALPLHARPAVAASTARCYARVEAMQVRDEKGNHFTLGEPVRTDLSEMDVVLLRQDPPFDMNYITTTHMLERIHPKTLVVNDPGLGAQQPGKDLRHRIPRPDAGDADHQGSAGGRGVPQASIGDIIVKPLYGNGGAGIFHLHEADRNLASLLEMFGQMFREPFIVQRYLKDVRKGDKRIILIDGEPVGAINRVPAEHDSRSNMHVGGRAEKTELTEREREICARIGPALRQRGFILVGIDVIGDYMTEINVTSPTGMREVSAFGGADIASAVLGCRRGQASLTQGSGRRAGTMGEAAHRSPARTGLF